jgi:N-acyl homoserine lactone hydrolase
MAIDYDIIVRGNNLALREGFLALANATLVFSGDGPLLFDTGHYCNRPALLNGLARHGLKPADMWAVFLSHLHFDHCNNIDLFPGARVFVGKREWDYARTPHPDDMFVPWLIHEQLQKHTVEFLDGEGRICDGVTYFPAPGHTPGSFALALDAGNKGRVVLAGDAIKYAKETLTCRCDMGFDAPETGTATIKRIIATADRIVPGHFPELVKTDGVLTWTETAELPLLIR